MESDNQNKTVPVYYRSFLQPFTPDFCLYKQKENTTVTKQYLQDFLKFVYKYSI